MDAAFLRALTALSGAIFVGGAAGWAIAIYVFVVGPRWLSAFTQRTQAILNFCQATQEEQREHGRTLERARTAVIEGEARLSQRISDTGAAVISEIRSDRVERIERAVDSIREQRSRDSTA